MLIPLLMSFFVMGFVDLVGIATNYVKADFHLYDTMANVLPSMLFFWFLVMSVPTGLLMKNGGYQTYYGGKVHMPVTGSDVNVLGYELLTLDERDSLAKVCADFLMNRKKNDKPFL